METEFTFYGDLLGIGSAYNLNPDTAYTKLNEFYNVTFETLSDFCEERSNRVEMFSDSLLICGNDALSALPTIATVFANLQEKGSLLRGAIVRKKLEYDARITRPNFGKCLPTDDTLARAVGLEKTKKGARFLIEPTLASSLMLDQGCQDWLTHEGYIRSIGLTCDESLRRVCPAPDSQSYEYLYYWDNRTEFAAYTQKVKKLKNLKAMYNRTTGTHYEETIGVVKRSQLRHKITSEHVDNRE